MYQDRERLAGWQINSAPHGSTDDILSPDAPLMPSASPRKAPAAAADAYPGTPRTATTGVRNQLNFLLNAADQLEQELATQREKNRRLEAQIMDAYRICESRIHDSSRKKENLFKENAELKATFDSYKYRNAELTAKINVMDKEVKRLKEAAGKYETTSQTLKDERKRMHQLVRDMKALAFENEDIARRLVEVQAENTGLNDTLRRETSRRKDAERALIEIRDSAETLNRMHADFKHVSTKIDTELRQTRDHLEHLTAMASEAAHDARKSIQITEVGKFNLEKSLSELRADMGRGATRITETRVSIERIQAEISETRARLAAIERGRDQESGALNEKITRPLKQAHEIIAAQVDRQENWIRSLQENFGAIRAQISEKQAATEATRDSVPDQALERLRASAETALATTNTRLAEFEKALAGRYERLNSLFTLKLGSMEDKLGSRFASREPTQSSVQKLRKDLEETRAENQSLRESLAKLSERLDRLEAKRKRKSRARTAASGSARVMPESPATN